MFSTLYEVVFPALGRFFGALVGIASSSSQNVLYWLWDVSFISAPPLHCVNVFTGATFDLSAPFAGLSESAPILGTALKILASPFFAFFQWAFSTFGLNNIPFVFGLLIVFASSLFAFVLIRFIISLIKA